MKNSRFRKNNKDAFFLNTIKFLHFHLDFYSLCKKIIYIDFFVLPKFSFFLLIPSN